MRNLKTDDPHARNMGQQEAADSQCCVFQNKVSVRYRCSRLQNGAGAGGLMVVSTGYDRCSLGERLGVLLQSWRDSPVHVNFLKAEKIVRFAFSFAGTSTTTDCRQYMDASEGKTKAVRQPEKPTQD